ncbi:MAG: sulfatase-like hydrolase/transferase [Proteobacteria bacterium]|nr:sulfatase-like hydrolase/transferase [Pseudomonadota bacterium]
MAGAAGERGGRSGGGVSPGLAASVYLAALYLLHALALRIANAAILLDTGAASVTALGPPVSLPFLLGEELVVGAALAGALWAAWRRPLLRGLWLAACGAYLLFLSGEQLAFKLFFTHVDYVLYQDSHDVAGLFGSIVGTLDGFFFVNAALALAIPILVAAPYRPRPVLAAARWVARRPLAAAAVALLCLGLTIALSVAAPQHGLDRPFPVAFAASVLAARAEGIAERRAMASPAPRPAAGGRPEVGATPSADELAGVRAALAAHGGKLNVVWYMLESTSFRETTLDPAQRYDTTPFLKRLAAKSVLFTRYHTGVAASTRAYYSVQTGLHPYMDQTSDLAKYSQLAVPTLIDVLRGAGWATAFFSSSDAMFESLDTFLAVRNFDAYMDKNLVPPEKRASVSMEAWGVDEEIVIDAALEWVAATRAAGRPFFLSYNAVVPHHPFSVPPAHTGLYDLDWGEKIQRARYRASLRYADSALERMVRGLERLGALEGTLLVVTPDHGEAFGDLHRKNFMHAEHCYEEDTHIFLLLHNPEVLGAPLVSRRLGSHVDMFPTLLEALGVRRELDVDGQSLIGAGWAEPPLYCFSRRQLALRRGDLKAIASRESRGVELYDLAADPGEQRDLAEGRPGEAAAARDELLRWKAESARKMRDRVAAAGLTDEEIGGRAAAGRQRLYGGVRLRIAAAAICPSAAASSCEAAGRPPRFGRGQPLAVWVRLARAARTSVRVEAFAPGGKRIHMETRPHAGGAEAVIGTLPGGLFAEPGRYKVKVGVVESYAVHDSRVMAFEVE